MTVFLATLGQRPEAITMALDLLDHRFHFDEIGIIYTHLKRKTVAPAFDVLMPEIERHYSDRTIHHHELTHMDGSPLYDIEDTTTADAYYTAMVKLLRDYRIQYTPIHLLIAGGRKAMSVYAALAAALLFGENDNVWTIITDKTLMEPGMFRVPLGQSGQVTMVQMQLPISRLIPGEIARQSVEELTRRTSPRQKFLSELTRTELEVAELTTQLPYATNEELALAANRALKTMERHLSSIYSKLAANFELHIDDRRKRQVLLDVMAGRV